VCVVVLMIGKQIWSKNIYFFFSAQARYLTAGIWKPFYLNLKYFFKIRNFLISNGILKKLLNLVSSKRIWAIIQAKSASNRCFWVHKTCIAWTQYLKCFDWDSNLKTCLLLGLEALKVDLEHSQKLTKVSRLWPNLINF